MCVDRTLERVAATSAQPVSRPRACKSQKKKGVAAHGRSSDAKCRAWQGGSVKIASRERSARYPLDLRIGEIDDFGEFADVGIAIADEVDESLDIERERGAFERDGALVVRDIIVVIDEAGAVRVAADNLGEDLGGETGERGVESGRAWGGGRGCKVVK